MKRSLVFVGVGLTLITSPIVADCREVGGLGVAYCATRSESDCPNAAAALALERARADAKAECENISYFFDAPVSYKVAYDTDSDGRKIVTARA
jgi:hypothetical protein